MKKRFPDRVEQEARDVDNRLNAGQHWRQIGGRKLKFNKSMVVFEMPHWYRYVCWYQSGILTRAELMSHERYNSIASNTRR